jgi:hypothetical protein
MILVSSMMPFRFGIQAHRQITKLGRSYPIEYDVYCYVGSINDLLRSPIAPSDLVTLWNTLDVNPI